MKNSMSKALQRGSINIEAAIILGVLVLMFAFTLFFGRLFWYYEISQKAAHDAVRFMSTASQVDMRTPGAGGAEAAVAGVARWIIDEEIAALKPYVYPLYIDVHCDFRTCGGSVPSTVHISILMRFPDNIFTPLTSAFTGQDGFLMVTDVTMRYAGT